MAHAGTRKQKLEEDGQECDKLYAGLTAALEKRYAENVELCSCFDPYCSQMQIQGSSISVQGAGCRCLCGHQAARARDPCSKGPRERSESAGQHPRKVFPRLSCSLSAFSLSHQASHDRRRATCFMPVFTKSTCKFSACLKRREAAVGRKEAELETKAAELLQREQAIDAKSAELQGLHAQLIPLYNRLCSQLPELQARCSVLSLLCTSSALTQSPGLITVHPSPLAGMLRVSGGLWDAHTCLHCKAQLFSSLRPLPMQDKAARRLAPVEAGCISGCAG